MENAHGDDSGVRNDEDDYGEEVNAQEEEDRVDDSDVEEEEDEENNDVQAVRIRRRPMLRIPRMLVQGFRRHYANLIGVNLPFEFQDETESDDEEQSQEARRPENFTFDKSLPTSHSYLGEMDECSGIQYIDQESFIVLPILRVPDFILVPGQTMPLNITRPQEVALLRSVLAREDKTFGVVMQRDLYGIRSASTIDYGCTAELRSMREEEVYEVQTMVGIAIGRQRFKIMEKRPQPDGNIVAKVQILNDDELSLPASGARLAYHHKLSVDLDKNIQKRKCCNFGGIHPGWLTSVPPWLYDMYDVKSLRRLLIKELKDWNPQLDEKTLPVSPSAFSFWIASHLMTTNAMRLFLLKIDCSVQRLRCELSLLKKCTIYACINCGNHITQKEHLFNMSVSGPMDAYVNPAGHIHETLTVYIAQGLVRVSRPSTEHSWFPGYAWTICECSSCGRHVGWKFTAAKQQLTPKKFWGLTRSSLFPKVEVDERVEEQETPLRRRRLTSSSSTSSDSLLLPRDATWRPVM